MAWRRRAPALLAAVLLTAGCIESDTTPGGTAAGLDGPVADVLEGDTFTPPADPPSGGPRTRLLATVDLSEVGSGEASYAVSAVPTADGAYVAVHGGDDEAWLATVAPTDDGLAVTDEDAMPVIGSLSGLDVMRVLDDGRVLMAGLFQPSDDPGGNYGFVVVDPASGEVQQTRVPLPTEDGFEAEGRFGLSDDGRTLYAAVHYTGPGVDRRLLAVDVATGEVVAEHDVRADPATAGYPWIDFWGVAARTDGGLRVLLRAGTEAETEVTVPMIVDYVRDLQPLGEPAPLIDEPADTATLLVPGAADGTVFAIVDRGAGGEVIAVPVGGDRPIPLVRSADIDWLERQAVEPGQVWLTVPLPWGAASIDLTTGEVAEPVDTGCRDGQGVRWALPGAADTTLLLGECELKETLWIVGA